MEFHNTQPYLFDEWTRDDETSRSRGFFVLTKPSPLSLSDEDYMNRALPPLPFSPSPFSDTETLPELLNSLLTPFSVACIVFPLSQLPPSHVFFALGRSEVEPHPLRKSISLVGANLQKRPEMCELPITNLPSRNKPFGANERATHIYMRLITLLSGATATVFADDAT